jgi:hypothetical protein
MVILNSLSWYVTGGTEEKREYIQPGKLVPIRASNRLGVPNECLLVFSSEYFISPSSTERPKDKTYEL